MKIWFFMEKNRPRGPVEAAEIAGRIQVNRIGPFDLVYKKGENRWRPVGEYLEFQAIFEKLKLPDVTDQWVALKKKPSGGYVQEGPYSSQAVRDLVQAGELNYTDFVWKKGMKEWYKIATFEEFASARPKKMEFEDTATGVKVPPYPEDTSVELLKNVMVQQPTELPKEEPPPIEAKSETAAESKSKSQPEFAPPLASPTEVKSEPERQIEEKPEARVNPKSEAQAEPHIPDGAPSDTEPEPGPEDVVFIGEVTTSGGTVRAKIPEVKEVPPPRPEKPQVPPQADVVRADTVTEHHGVGTGTTTKLDRVRTETVTNLRSLSRFQINRMVTIAVLVLVLLGAAALLVRNSTLFQVEPLLPATDEVVATPPPPPAASATPPEPNFPPPEETEPPPPTPPPAVAVRAAPRGLTYITLSVAELNAPKIWMVTDAGPDKKVTLTIFGRPGRLVNRTSFYKKVVVPAQARQIVDFTKLRLSDGYYRVVARHDKVRAQAEFLVGLDNEEFRSASFKQRKQAAYDHQRERRRLFLELQALEDIGRARLKDAGSAKPMPFAEWKKRRGLGAYTKTPPDRELRGLLYPEERLDVVEVARDLEVAGRLRGSTPDENQHVLAELVRKIGLMKQRVAKMTLW